MAMLLKLSVPLALNLNAKNESDLDPTVEFTRNGARIKVTFAGTEPLHIETADEPFWRTIYAYELEIEIPAKTAGHYQRLINSCSYADVAGRLVPIVNRVNRALRNFGWVSNVREIKHQSVEAKLLSDWKVKWLNDSGEWHDIYKADGFGSIGLPSFLWNIPLDNRKQLSVARWPDISEAIEENYTVKPEDEFITNALEHLEEGNLRVAIVEAFVCLEIVLSQFLKVYFTVRQGYNEHRLRRLEKTSIVSKVGLILDLIMKPDEKQTINLDSVLQAYAWRNDVVHRFGHLPRAVAEKQVRGAIFDTLRLAHQLSFRRDEIAVEPEARNISLEIGENHPVPVPQISLWRRHFVHALFDYPFFPHFGLKPEDRSKVKPLKRDRETLEAVVKHLEKKCKERDPLFKPEIHLSAYFKDSQEIFCSYDNGQWNHKET
jgi:hypothetical protein